MATTAHLEKLNAAQRKAVTHGEALAEKGYRAGPLLIVAGAGTGKTDTLAHRVAHLVIHGVDPARILMLTFTRRAATEMRRRAQEITRKALDEPLGGIGHSIAQRLSWTVADGMKGTRPAQALGDAVADAAQRFVECLARDFLRAAAHFSGRAARESQHQDTGRIHAVDHQVRHAVRQSVGLAGARAGDDQQRPRAVALLGKRLAMSHRLALCGVEFFEVRCGGHGFGGGLYLPPTSCGDPTARCAAPHTTAAHGAGAA